MKENELTESNGKSYLWNGLSSLCKLMLIIIYHWQRKRVIFHIRLSITLLVKRFGKRKTVQDIDQTTGKLWCQLKNLE